MDNEVLYKYRRSLSNERFRLTILPTEECNFRCSYCWEKYRHGKMRKPVVEGIKKLLSYRFPGLKLLEIEWFGGEPLLAGDIITDVSSHIQQLGGEYPRVVCKGGITTNGYLLDLKTFERLYRLGVEKYSICLDGLSEWHDRTRILANGQGTFNTIINNLVAIKQTSLDFKMTITVNFVRKNYLETVVPLLDYLSPLIAGDDRFSLFFKSIQRLGGKNDCEIEPVDPNEESEISRKLEEHVNGIRVVRFDPANHVCYAAEPNAMVLRANGDINKCIVALDEAWNKVGRINPDGTLRVDNEKYMLWSKGFQPLDTAYLKCPRKFIKEIYG